MDYSAFKTTFGGARDRGLRRGLPAAEDSARRRGSWNDVAEHGGSLARPRGLQIHAYSPAVKCRLDEANDRIDPSPCSHSQPRGEGRLQGVGCVCRRGRLGTAGSVSDVPGRLRTEPGSSAGRTPPGASSVIARGPACCPYGASSVRLATGNGYSRTPWLVCHLAGRGPAARARASVWIAMAAPRPSTSSLTPAPSWSPEFFV